MHERNAAWARRVNMYVHRRGPLDQLLSADVRLLRSSNTFAGLTSVYHEQYREWMSERASECMKRESKTACANVQVMGQAAKEYMDEGIYIYASHHRPACVSINLTNTASRCITATVRVTGGAPT
eukprot:GHVU01077830.1.p2 GENE.GHVU01077830.1~~GHVU01077830.1.p2  ORF type:complete len:125 (+),score=6.69 GHVU01077830.1:273-647(+)